MFQSVVVANRGEIAVRILRTCRRLGIRTIAVYSDADRDALHVAMADAAYRIGPALAAESYLNINAILDVCRRSQASAVHPGYGFLAENPDFADACQKAGLIWIGPPPEAMRRLGDKAQAKALAEGEGVPVLPGYHGEDQTPNALAHHAAEIGFPVLIKASAGGGGRGMRVVEQTEEFLPALEGAQREAQAAFGDRRVLLERYVRRPRHIEIQVLGDHHGNLVHLGERECSIQRRHQKLIEESPSPAVDAVLRAEMGDAALRLARAAGYTNAGTVEFLLDEQGRFAFLEVNTRLQVEHPVTEAVTGLDLVEQQLRIVSGEPLSFGQSDIQLHGHALEVRVIAEDPSAGFLPSSGTVSVACFPHVLRVDTWLRESRTYVPPYYDSLLAKVISHGTNRSDALARLVDALRETRIDGIKSNIDLLLAVVEHPAFRSGALHTRFLEEHKMVESLAEVPAEALAAVAATDSAWRIARIDQPSAWLRAGQLHTALVSADLESSGLDVQVGTTTCRVTPTVDTVRVNGCRVPIVETGADRRVVEWQGRSYRLIRQPALEIGEVVSGRQSGAGRGGLTAPMPGRIVKIGVAEGEKVKLHQPLVVLEAMKMEHVVEAPHAGVVDRLCVAVGDQVASGTLLLELGAEDA